ncbi:MAG: YHYH protein [Pseudomonadota bacterium]
MRILKYLATVLTFCSAVQAGTAATLTFNGASYLLEIPYLSVTLDGSTFPVSVNLNGAADLSAFTVDANSLNFLMTPMSGSEIATLTQTAGTYFLLLPRVSVSIGDLMQDYSVRFQSSNLLEFTILLESVSELGGSSSSADILSAWKINTTETSSTISGAVVNVQSATQETVNGQEFARIQASGIPNYLVTITQAIFDALTNRPRASTDFSNGAPAVSVNQQVAFGQDVGYSSNGCSLGYWPPGPVCPEATSHNGLIPLNPTAGSDECMSGLGTTGYAVNGVSIFNWWDGQSANNEGVWHVNAPVAEGLDVDICGGHAANGTYHHHAWNSCWATVAGEDESTGHSPVYGYAADGYAIYGPWHDKGNNTLAQSCWKKRDYSNTALGGCGDGARSCTLNDPTDLSQGTTTTSSPGPNTGGLYTTLSNNEVSTDSGLFYEDYYYDSTCTALGPAYLDEHNGHDHDNLSYHYHLTLEEGGTTAAFPYTFGPFYRGTLPSGGVATCGSLTAGGGMPGGGTGMGPPPGR